jgi:hypothetical protein
MPIYEAIFPDVESDQERGEARLKVIIRQVESIQQK